MNCRLAALLRDHGVDPTEALVDAVATLVFEAIAAQDPSPKMVLHEPYRSIADEVDNFLLEDPSPVERLEQVSE